MFAIVIENPPLSLRDVPGAVHTWLHAAGGFAAIALIAWLVSRVLTSRGRGPAERISGRAWRRWFLLSFLGGLLVAGAVLLLPTVWEKLSWMARAESTTKIPGKARLVALLLDFVSGFALAAAAVPVIANIPSLRWRRIWALSRLSIKEARRSRVLWAFSALLLIFLFASWFLPYKPEDQVRNYVGVVFFAMTVLLLLTAAMLSAFSIPADIRRQTIHTIVTKPVERYEIVLGRFIGYTLLMTGVLFVMTLFSLVYVTRGIEKEAAEESLKARVPIYGDLRVAKSQSVGREWQYRAYIAGGDRDARGIWTFDNLPAALGERDKVRCEFTFDIFRTFKGDERAGVAADFRFESPAWDDANTSKFNDERLELQNKGEDPDAIDARLAEKYGLYEARSVRIEDYHTQFIDIPGVLFRPAEKQAPAADKASTTAPSAQKPAMAVSVRFIDPGQYLGMAKHDFYILGNQRPFALNFFKGALGLWFRLCLVIGLAVACSTYLSGVISFLATVFLYIAGLCLPFINDLAEKKAIGGGPIESILRLQKDVGPVRDLDPSPAYTLAMMMDNAFSFFLKPFTYFIPDVNRFDLTSYVAEGFDVSGSMLLWDNLLPLVGYMALWAIFAYYLMKSREIAS